jgi:hypothetical protein
VVSNRLNGRLTREDVLEEIYQFMEAFASVVLIDAPRDLVRLFGRARASRVWDLGKWKSVAHMSRMPLPQTVHTMFGGLSLSANRTDPSVDAAMALAVVAKIMRFRWDQPPWARALLSVPQLPQRPGVGFTREQADRELRRAYAVHGTG